MPPMVISSTSSCVTAATSARTTTAAAWKTAVACCARCCRVSAASGRGRGRSAADEGAGSALAVSAALPGGDPLAEALAAGETPSPELVAAAGAEGSRHPGAAGVMIALSFLAILGVVLTAGSYPIFWRWDVTLAVFLGALAFVFLFVAIVMMDTIAYQPDLIR